MFFFLIQRLTLPINMELQIFENKFGKSFYINNALKAPKLIETSMFFLFQCFIEKIEKIALKI